MTALHENHHYYNLMYSAYSYPNIVLPLLGGLIIDRYGYSRISILLFFLITVGILLFYISALAGDSINIFLAITGRSIFGIGNESLASALSVATIAWFSTKHIAFALTI